MRPWGASNAEEVEERMEEEEAVRDPKAEEVAAVRASDACLVGSRGG